MSLKIIGLVLHSLGTILIAWMALGVHRRVWREHRIDDKVFGEMKLEQSLGFLGVFLIIVGFVLQLIAEL